MKTLDDIRKEIDDIDVQIRSLLMKRMDCSEQVVSSKIKDQNYAIYRADREEAMLKKLGDGIPDNRRPEYLSVVRKITETSRMYQYGILFDAVPELYRKLVSRVALPKKGNAVKVVLTRPNIPNAMSSILSMVGDYGYNMDQMRLLRYARDNSSVDFELVILGDIHDTPMQKLMLQLSMESIGFCILEVL